MRQTRRRIARILIAVALPVACGGIQDEAPAEVEVEDQEVVDEEAAAEPDADPEPDEGPVVDPEEPTEPPSEPVDEVPASTEGTPEPDAERLADPCADHEGREAEAFIDLVAPVNEQVASGEVEIVGCSNVYEATVAWWLLDGDGRTLDEGFTTAECGSGCVGEFRDTISLDAFADEPVAYLQVFSPNASDEGPEQLELTEVILVIG
jgi:hypothetical protein